MDHQMTAETFFRLRTRMLEAQIIRAQFQDQMRAREQAMLVEAGLDPQKAYRLDEATLSASLIEPEAV